MLHVKTFILVMLSSSVILADIDNGKELFDQNNCVKCHATSQFKFREDKVHNYDKLHSMVDACAFNTKVGWFDDEVEDVASYLNQNFYKFKVVKKEEED